MTSLKKTRFAPTPSGFLHMGNIYNLLLTYLVAESENAKLGLRIDDIDRARFRSEYLEDIFHTCDFLGVHFSFGPSSIDEFHKSYSQGDKIEWYRSFLCQIKNSFICDCTRKSLSTFETSIYPGVCRQKNLSLNAQGILKTRVRMGENINANHLISNNKKSFNFSEIVGDFILWNHEEDRPSYQLVSMAHDMEDDVSIIVRGEDLLESTFSQEYLRYLLKIEDKISYIHHELIKEGDQKISKSVLGHSKGKLSDQYSRKEIISFFASHYFKQDLKFEDLSELKEFFQDQKETLSFESVSLT